MTNSLSFKLRRMAVGAGILAVFWMVAASAVAQQGAGSLKVRTTASGTPLDAPLVGLEEREGRLPLSLEKAIEIALERNLGLLVERYTRERTELRVLGSEAIYDLRLTSSFDTRENNPATVNVTQRGQFRSDSLDLGLSRLTPYGGEGSVSVSASEDSTTNLDFSTAATSLGANMNFSFVQPLLRDFGRLATERGLRLARYDSSLSREDFEQQLNLILQQVENAYWILINAREQLNVAEEALALAKELHERNRIEVEVGTRAPLELVQSEAQIATREEEIITAQTALGDAEDRLRRLLNLPSDLWAFAIDPTTPAISDPVEIDLEEAIATAVAERPELRRQQLSVDRFQLDADYFRNQKRPRLDLTLNYNLGGVVADDPDNNLGDAFSQVFDRDFEGWRVGLDFALPLQNRAARANSLNADLAAEQAMAQLQDLEQQILTEVRTAVRGVRSATQQIASAQASRRLQERNLEAQQKRYENGMSTSFEVTRIQDDLTQARFREVNAITNYRISLVEYRLAVGRLPDQFGIELVDAEEPGPQPEPAEGEMEE